MANLKSPLSVNELEQLRDQGLHAVGGVPGLLLKVSSGGRSWIYRHTFEGLRKKVGLGPFTTLGLLTKSVKVFFRRDAILKFQRHRHERGKRRCNFCAGKARAYRGRDQPFPSRDEPKVS